MDAVTLALIKSMAGNGGGGGSADDVVLNATPTYHDGYWTIAITSQLPSASDLEAWFNENRHIVLHFSSDAWYARLYAAEKDISGGYIYYSFTGYGENFDGDKIRYLLKFSVSEFAVTCVASAYIDGKYLVTLTPTALDYSGTMDKTVAEINAAYEAGQEIVFCLDGSGASLPRFYIPVTCVEDGVDTYPSFQSQVLIATASQFLAVYTPSTNTGTDSVYGVYAYALTPAS